MKNRILSLVLACSIVFGSCSDTYTEIGRDDLQQRVSRYHASLPVVNNGADAKIDKQKALMLALVDAGAGYSVSGVWAIPVVGVYAGLWISFAASWAASGANNRAAAPSIEKKVDTAGIESLISSTSAFANPYEELGKKHNQALNTLGTTEISMLDDSGNLKPATETYMVNTPFMTTTQADRTSFITNSINRSNVENAFETFGRITNLTDLADEVRSNANATPREKDFVLSVQEY
ncbi:MAG TPA: hypothetical protein VFQ50_04275, partial [Flavobacterium sp.]|nr:hypothetical protein [Flavobacterium sp.]